MSLSKYQKSFFQPLGKFFFTDFCLPFENYAFQTVGEKVLVFFALVFLSVFLV